MSQTRPLLKPLQYLASRVGAQKWSIKNADFVTDTYIEMLMNDYADYVAEHNNNKTDPTTVRSVCKLLGLKINRTKLRYLIDIIEVVSEKGDQITLKDIAKLEESWVTPDLEELIL